MADCSDDYRTSFRTMADRSDDYGASDDDDDDQLANAFCHMAF
jgi:hypothetical protein